MSYTNAALDNESEGFDRFRKTPSNDAPTKPYHKQSSYGGQNQTNDFQGAKRPMPTFFNSKK
jgi:hypothetical protein